MQCNIGDSKNGKDIPTKVKGLWRRMLNRCYNPNMDKYRYYGGKGVTVCNDWLTLELFYKDIQLLDGYDIWLTDSSYSLDKDINGNGMMYDKESCIFTDRYKQNQAHDKVKQIRVYNDSHDKVYSSMREVERCLGIYLTKIRRILQGITSNDTEYKFEVIDK